MKTKYIFNRMKKSHCCTVRCMSETHIFKHNCPKAVKCRQYWLEDNLDHEKSINISWRLKEFSSQHTVCTQQRGTA